MNRRTSVLKTVVTTLLMVLGSCLTSVIKAQTPANADAMYNGFLNAYLVNSNGATYFATSLTNRSEAFQWNQAYLITGVEDAYERSRTADKQMLISNLLTRYIQTNFTNHNSTNLAWDSWNDDSAWATIALARGYLITGNPTFLTDAEAVWNMAYNRGYSSALGGGIWENQEFLAKCALSNLSFVPSGIILYQATGDPSYLTKSESLYAWTRANLFDASGGQVNECVNANGTVSVDKNVYNSGLLVNAAAYLYKVTEIQQYFDDASTAANFQVLRYPIMTPDYIYNGPFGADQFFRGLSNFARENGLWGKYSRWFTSNATAAWNMRRTDYNITQNNLSAPTPPTGDIVAMETESAMVLQQVAQTPPVANVNVRLMPLGDSITAGYLSSTGNGYRGPLWTALSGQVATQNFVGTQLDGTMSDPNNEGHFGYEISQIATLATGALNTYKPNMVALDIGVNDLLHDDNVATAPAREGSLIDQILSAEPDATVLVAQLIVNNTASIQARIGTFNNQLSAIVQARANAGAHVYLVDMSALTTDDLADGLHPNDIGYQLMANAWDAAIQHVISLGWISGPLAGSATRPLGSIYSGIAGKCLDDYTDSGVRGVKAALSDCNGSAEQQWNVNNTTVSINGLCLDIVANATTNGALVDLWSCSGAPNQVWSYVNGALVNPASGRCLDDPKSSTTNGVQLQIWDCNGGSNQQWQIASEGSVASGVTGKCLDDLGGSIMNRTPAVISTCNNSAEQQWKVTNHTLQFNGSCLDITGAQVANGTPVALWGCNGQSNQIWQYQNGALYNPASGKCLDDPGGSTVDGAQLDIWDCNGGSNQQWTLPTK